MGVASPGTRQYTLILDPDPGDGGYAVHVPALPGCHTQGDTVPEALAHADEAIIGHLEVLAADGLPLPEEREPAQAFTVVVQVPFR